MSTKTRFPLMLLAVLGLMTTLGRAKIGIMDSAITNPSMLALCEKS